MYITISNHEVYIIYFIFIIGVIVLTLYYCEILYMLQYVLILG